MPRLADTARAYAALARWLGPWTAEDRAPGGVTRRVIDIAPARAGDQPFRARLYLPARPPSGAYLIAPGLHYAGPADPRMDRLCAVMAGAGFAVLAPWLPDYTALRVVPSALSDFERALDALLERPELAGLERVGIFSISFGSLPALHAAARAARRDRIGALVLFGGYASWQETIDFALTGEIDGRPHTVRDPLNQPVVFMNLVDELPGAPADPQPLLAAWRRYVEATWGRAEMKAGDRHVDVARALAAELPAELRPLFLVGCGAEPGGRELAAAALERSAARTAFLDPAPYAADVRCPVDLVHGVDDDVIPYVHARALAALLPPAARPRVHLTGLYGHTRRESGATGPRALARELATMARILRAFVDGAMAAG